MKVILHRGGNYIDKAGKDKRFEASPAPQDVPAQYGKAMIARGLAEEPARGRGAPPAAPEPDPIVTDEPAEAEMTVIEPQGTEDD